MRLVLLGPPGSGKGTQSVRLAGTLAIAHISTGDILRAAVREGTELGRKAESFIRQGGLVPDEVIVGMVEERIARADCSRGFIFDGFPRTIPQAEMLESRLGAGPRAGNGGAIDRVLYMDLDEESCVRRLAGRWTCPADGRTYNQFSQPPKAAGKCDRCGGALVQREDDRGGAGENRLQVDLEQTPPLLRFF